MPNPEHYNWLFEEGVDAWNRRRQKSDFVPDLTGVGLNGANLAKVNFSKAILTNAYLGEADLENADLEGANLQGASLSGANFRGAKLQATNFSSAELLGAYLEDAKLHFSNLDNATLFHANLDGANLYKASLRGASLRGGSFVGAKFFAAHLEGANLFEALLIGSDLSFANLRDADLREAKLIQANLCGADLTGTKFANTYFRDASVRTLVPSLSFEKIKAVDFRKALDLTQDQIDSMIGDTKVLLPHDLSHPESWIQLSEDETGIEGKEKASPYFVDITNTDQRKLEHLLAETGPVTSIVRNEKIDIVSTPPDGRPSANDPSDRDQLFDAIVDSCCRFYEAWEAENPQIDKKGIFAAIGKCKDLAQEHDLNWYKWEERRWDLSDYLKSNPDEDAWRTLDRKTRRIIGRISQLEKYLKPLPNEETGVLDLKQPEVQITADIETRVPELVDKVDKLARAIQAPPVQNIFYGDVGKFVQTQADTIKTEQHPTQLPDEYSNPVSQGKWTRALRGLAGFTVTLLANLALGGLSGVLGNTLTTDTAWPYFVSLLVEVRDLLLMFFKSS